MIDATVVVPIRNAAEHIPALLSALDRLQGPSIEIIIVDDHSADAGPALVDAWTPRNGHHKRLLPSMGEGVAAARNTAVAAATGEYLWFADADDTWRDNLLERLLDAARSGDHDLAICNAERIDQATGARALLEDAPHGGFEPGAEVVQLLLRGKVQGHLWNKLFRRTLFAQVHFPATRAHSDLGGLLQFCARAGTVVFVPEVLYEYRVHAGSILHGSHYRWRDLPDVLAIAINVVQKLPNHGGDSRDLSVFAARCVWLPLAHEAIRRRSARATDQGAEMAWIEAREHLRWSQLVALLLEHHVKLVVSGIALKLVPELYAASYRAYRRRYLTELDVRL